MITYEEVARTIGALVDVKNKAYGSSFEHGGEVLKVLYPTCILPQQYSDMLCMARVIDKLFRIATDKDAFGESPWQDIAGYGILKTAEKYTNGADFNCPSPLEQIAEQVDAL